MGHPSGILAPCSSLPPVQTGGYNMGHPYGILGFDHPGGMNCSVTFGSNRPNKVKTGFNPIP